MPEIRYQNPVWPEYFADPYVLRVEDTFYAYGTGPADEKRNEFPALRSNDLVHWQPLGGALRPLDHPKANNYWAPEVIRSGQHYYLYYSASTTDSDADQRLRVAVSDKPQGPFIDTGNLLLPELGFSIDANPFIDPRDGKPYLFFASDYEGDEPAGTGIGVVPLSDDLLHAAGPMRTVVRASTHWQVYERNRNYKGKIWSAWHCVEGPFVVFRDGRYYCFYSGGAWHGAEYGVEVATSEHPLGPWVDDRALRGPSVLKGIPGKVVGPGHCSVVIAPDNCTWMMVYHAWDPAHTRRRMCIDPIRWDSGGPIVDGPSTDPRRL